MTSPTIPFHTFVVRFRLEATATEPHAEHRGMVIHLPGYESMAFRAAAALVAFIHRMLAGGAGTPDAGGDRST